MKKIISIIGGALVLVSIILPWYSISTTNFGTRGHNLLDINDISLGFDMLGYELRGNEKFQYFLYMVIGSGLIGIFGGLKNKYELSLLGALGSLGSAALFAFTLMNTELGSKALWGSISIFSFTSSFGVSLGFGLVIIGGILLLVST